MQRLAWIFALAPLALACSSSSTHVEYVDEPVDGGYSRDGSIYDSAPPPGSTLGQLRFQPTQSYSGFDGTHTFQVPVAVYDGASDLVVTASDPSAVTITPAQLANPVSPDGLTDTGKYFLVTVQKAGTITLSAKSGGKTVTTTITAASYAADRYATGQARYASGSPACTDCHVNGQAIDHSPAALATVDDAKVGTVITNGISPAGFPIQGVDGGHRWSVTAAELDGLVTYLRGLTPRGFK
jgi:hypothetical protein